MCTNILNLAKQIYWKKFLKNLAIQNVMVRRNILSSVHGNIEIPNITLPEFIFQSFDKYPNETAVECSLTRKKYTFDEIRIKSKNFNKNLRKKLKLSKGDVVGIILPNVPDYPICLLGAIQAGLIVTIINPSYTAEEINHQLSEVGTKAVITLNTMYSTIKAAAQISGRSIPILTVKIEQAESVSEGAIDLNEFTETEPQILDISGENITDTVLLPFSSGTTGLPKGVELTHYNIISNICQVSCDAVNHLSARTDNHINVVPAILPWFHMYGVTSNLLKQLYNFSKIISMPKFTPDKFIKLLSEYKPNVLNLVPPLISFISSNPLVTPQLLERLTVVTSGAAPLSKIDEEQFIRKIGKHVDVLQGYGLTETCSVVSVATIESIKTFGRIGSCGLLLPNTSIKIVSTVDKTEILEKNEKGEILIKGPQVMKGYRNRHEKTDEAFTDGWFRSGDLGYIDANGLLYVTDRLKELIKVKGFQVAPAELEEVLRAHHDISDAAVIGIPDTVSGEVPLAFVVAKLNSKVDIKSLHNYMSKKVASYKQLNGGVIVVDALPKTASGKTLRKELKSMYNKKYVNNC
ncbi:hypothetical protein RN001_003372 [Aquatica leii]|uniref:4-coumarate--CoA ligase n=1 Tax=Aquatica leii TaxID=1421715 RepID=A0AAN7SDX8_9COLE|nr:hypothetical protein RN001_003372 [Aquatica leii]